MGTVRFCNILCYGVEVYEDENQNKVRDFLWEALLRTAEGKTAGAVVGIHIRDNEQPDVTTPQTPPQMLQTPPMALQDISSHSNVSRDGDILKVMQKQNVITELLVKQQKQSQLPTKDIPVFRGDALQYKSFIRAFEHSIEQKTDNDQDKLYFLEQFTNGEPQELVRSCVHMQPSRGYKEAKRLLHKHYGDELRIASAYIDKALQ
ncbi:hypothetical protein AAFF_G00065750 [Aldrovandia affinis]|uniref:Uncharacterized protein n=1 Tax=Aldrovandia affinis TaxID=143900 RepID=A0AAD7T575_9TELE|nr:hypothetical protein AAFF_G00065750 [Aldrovandia affinis]